MSAPALDGSRADQAKKRLAGGVLVGGGQIGALARKDAALPEILHDATAQDAGELLHVAVLEGRRGVEYGTREGGRAGEDAIDHESVEMKVEIEGAAEALCEDDRAGAGVREALARGAAALPAEYDAHEDAAHSGA